MIKKMKFYIVLFGILKCSKCRVLKLKDQIEKKNRKNEL